MKVVRSKLRARSFAPAAGAGFAFVALAFFSGCFVSFDGYQLGAAGAAGSVPLAGGPSAGASGESGAAHGGAGNEAGTSGRSGGAAGKSGGGGAAAGGAGNEAGTAGQSSSGAAGQSSSGAGGVSGAGAGGGGTSGAATGGAGAGGAGTLRCPETNNRLSVEIPIAAGEFYCIDRAEVKNAEYKAFTDAQSVASAVQPASCAFNTSFAPATAAGCRYDPTGLPKVPVACVDWCDAAAYCKWEGKHLCGKVGGGPNASNDFADANKSAWYRACSKAGTLAFPYGQTYQMKTCIGLENDSVYPVSVPFIDCEGGYPGLYDMSGNVSEWEDSCNADSGGTDQCLERGGSYLSSNAPVGSSPSLLCNSSAQKAARARNTRDKEIGFRCCSEPIAGL